MVIVDDYSETAQSLALIYRAKNNVEVVGFAQTSKQLWKILSTETVDLVSLDIQLGKENGIEICRLVHQRYPELFIVMCSIEVTLENQRLANEAGASHFLAKPVTMNEAEDTIQKFSNRHRNLAADMSPLQEKQLEKLLNLL
jgi:DNA-binding NarL/FixJ family response regulator